MTSQQTPAEPRPTPAVDMFSSTNQRLVKALGWDRTDSIPNWEWVITRVVELRGWAYADDLSENPDIAGILKMLGWDSRMDEPTWQWVGMRITELRTDAIAWNHLKVPVLDLLGWDKTARQEPSWEWVMERIRELTQELEGAREAENRSAFLERQYELAAGWRKEFEPELLALRAQVGDETSDQITSLTKQLRIARDTGERRLAAALNASEARRKRVVEMEVEVRNVRADQRQAQDTANGLQRQVSSLREQSLVVRRERSDADAALILEQGKVRDLVKQVADLNAGVEVFRRLAGQRHKQHQADSEKIANQRRALAEQERIHRQHGEQLRALQEEVNLARLDAVKAWIQAAQGQSIKTPDGLDYAIMQCTPGGALKVMLPGQFATTGMRTRYVTAGETLHLHRPAGMTIEAQSVPDTTALDETPREDSIGVPREGSKPWPSSNGVLDAFATAGQAASRLDERMRRRRGLKWRVTDTDLTGGEWFWSDTGRCHAFGDGERCVKAAGHGDDHDYTNG